MLFKRQLVKNEIDFSYDLGRKQKQFSLRLATINYVYVRDQ